MGKGSGVGGIGFLQRVCSSKGGNNPGAIIIYLGAASSIPKQFANSLSRSCFGRLAAVLFSAVILPIVPAPVLAKVLRSLITSEQAAPPFLKAFSERAL